MSSENGHIDTMPADAPAEGRAVKILEGCVLDVLPTLPAGSVHMTACSPPYFGLRDYGLEPSDWPAVSYAPMAGLPSLHLKPWTGCLGLEPDPWAYVGHLVTVFRLVRRVLRDDGTLWLNLGDSFANDGKWGGSTGGKHVGALHGNGAVGRQKRNTGLKPKDLIGIPWRVALALQADGWYLRSEIIWHKPNPMPESVTDRPTRAHEQVFLLTKKAKYFYDHEAVKEKGNPEGSHATGNGLSGAPMRNDRSRKIFEQGTSGKRNRRTVWKIATQPSKSGEQTVHRLPVVADAVSYDTRRIASEDCPVHAFLDRQHPTGVHDARVVYVDCHIPGSDGDLVRMQLADYASIEEIRALLSADEGAFSLHASALSARPRNNQNHKKAPAPSTSTPGTFFGKTIDDTEHTEASPPSASTHKSNGESKTLQAESAERGGDKSSGNSHTEIERLAYLHEVLLACSCSFYTELTETSSHYASWPSRLVAPMIKAGTSERGVCPACLSPYERVVERTEITRPRPDGSARERNRGGRKDGFTKMPNGVAGVSTKTTGWRATCDHGHPEPIPATVLDIFAGTGTTGDTARRLGRHAVLIDRSGAYVEMQREALAQHELF